MVRRLYCATLEVVKPHRTYRLAVSGPDYQSDQILVEAKNKEFPNKEAAFREALRIAELVARRLGGHLNSLEWKNKSFDAEATWGR